MWYGGFFSHSKKFIFVFKLDYCADKASMTNYKTSETNEKPNEQKLTELGQAECGIRHVGYVAKCADVTTSGSQRKIIFKRVESVCNTHQDP